MAWLDRMPALLLARAVPVTTPDGRKGIVQLVLRGPLARGGEGSEVAWDDGEHGTTGEDTVDSFSLRVDLDDPQGFGYALRLLLRATEPGGDIDQWRAAHRHHESVWQKHGWLEHHACGSVSDHIRLALAKALAEVF